jgi:hypothetical protein
MTASPNAARFLERWHAMLRDKDTAALDALVADDATVSSPMFWKPKGPKSYVLTILRAVVTGVEDFRYTREWRDGDGMVLEFEGRIGETNLKGVDIILLNAEGRLQHIEVLIRPLNGLMALGELVKKAFAP